MMKAGSQSQRKKARLAQRTAEKDSRRKEKKKRQIKTLTVLAAIVIGAFGLLALFLCGRGIYRAVKNKVEEDPLSMLAHTKDPSPDLLAGYWWFDETGFFCIEDGVYRSYTLSPDGKAFLISAENKAAMAGRYLFLLSEDDEEDPVVIEYILSDSGRELELRYSSSDSAPTYAIPFTAGDPPTIPMLSPKDAG